MARSSTRPHSDGYWHTQITWMLCVPAFFLGVALSTRAPHPQEPYAFVCAVSCALGCALGAFLSPDLDLPTITVSEWMVIRIPIIGWILGPLFVAFWMPYALVFKHRSFWTHTPVISTIGRVWYILSAILLLHALRPGWDIVPTLLEWVDSPLKHWSLFAGFIGLCLSDTGHWLRDIGILA